MSQDSHCLLSFLPARCLASVSFLADTRVEKEGLFLALYDGGFRPILWAGGSTESRPTRIGCSEQVICSTDHVEEPFFPVLSPEIEQDLATEGKATEVASTF